MFFNSIFDEPQMFYQSSPFFARKPTYIRRPRTVYRRPQRFETEPDRFGFSDFIGGLNNYHEIPIRMVDESENIKHRDLENHIDNIKNSGEQNPEINEFKTKECKLQDFTPQDSIPQDSELQESETPESDQPSENNPASETSNNTEKTSANTDLILEILKTSQNIENDLDDNIELTDIKQATKKLKYAAENQYKLLEKLDMIQVSDSREKLLRKSAVKSIQKRLDSTDARLADLENK